MSEDSLPRYDIEDVAKSWSDLYVKLMNGTNLPKRPFWLNVGDAGFKITDENRDNLSLGMLLGMSIRNQGLR